ncbi:hypothetical protein [Flavobacterium succinicans]|uniref:Uncharacterized protein n=1 Tax=Flavobacterium succinicans TaxID=29536 RepID=A0A199XPN2_9FLAO|nr:hypothetical protein [Flavobacterium succinicans]OAZ03294.1 hypothetical protein FLB_23230 [Flavobacterium succinicans]
MTLLFPKLDVSIIFDKYDKEIFLPKLKNLKYFCLLRGRLNSHIEDGDQLIAHFTFIDRLDLLDKFRSIGFEPHILENGEPRFDKPIPADIADKFPTPIKQFPDIAQPYVQKLFGYDTFIIVYENYFSLSICDKTKKNWHYLTEKDLELAKQFEVKIEESGLGSASTYEGQTQYGRYINRYHYPELLN